MQARFVDDPSTAVHDADALVGRVMETRGYPVGDFEQRAADVSVDYPTVVEHYRAAHAIALRHAQSQVSTEELRQALVAYRALFAELLEEPRTAETRPDDRPPARHRLSDGILMTEHLSNRPSEQSPAVPRLRTGRTTARPPATSPAADRRSRAIAMAGGLVERIAGSSGRFVVRASATPPASAVAALGGDAVDRKTRFLSRAASHTAWTSRAGGDRRGRVRGEWSRPGQRASVLGEVASARRLAVRLPLPRAPAPGLDPPAPGGSVAPRPGRGDARAA